MILRRTLKRIKTLEEFLGIHYVNRDYPEHIVDHDSSWGKIVVLEKRIKALENAQPKKDKK